VARFLALLELYRDGVVLFDQPTPLGDLHIRWVGGDRDGIGANIDEFDASAAADFDLKAGAEDSQLDDVIDGDTIVIDDVAVVEDDSADEDLDGFEEQAEAMWARLAIELGDVLDTSPPSESDAIDEEDNE